MSSIRTADKIQMGSAARMEKHRDAPLNKQPVSVQGLFWALALPGVNAQKLFFTRPDRIWHAWVKGVRHCFQGQKCW